MIAIIVVIVVNTLALASDRHPISAAEAKVLEWVNLACSVLFFLEMLVKLAGLGVKSYS